MVSLDCVVTPSATGASFCGFPFLGLAGMVTTSMIWKLCNPTGTTECVSPTTTIPLVHRHLGGQVARSESQK